MISLKSIFRPGNRLLGVITFLLFSCCKDELPEDVPMISSTIYNIHVFDVDNDITGNDLRVTFKSFNDELTEFWFIVNPISRQLTGEEVSQSALNPTGFPW